MNFIKYDVSDYVWYIIHYKIHTNSLVTCNDVIIAHVYNFTYKVLHNFTYKVFPVYFVWGTMECTDFPHKGDFFI